MRRRRLDGLTLVGLLMVAAGWAILLFGARAGDHVGAAWPQLTPYWPQLERNAAANALILTGFGFAILGALRCGFGALNRFFDAVLGSIPAPESKPDRLAAEFEAALAEPKPVVAETIRRPPRPPVRPPGVASYVIRDDGTAEVETLLGVRRFSSEREAREFLGA